MGLSSDLISNFAKVTKKENKKKSEATVSGTVVIYGNLTYVKFDGSDLLTPVSLTSEVKDGDRVNVLVKNHTATVTGNISSPSASVGTVEEIGERVREFEKVIANKADIEELNATKATVDNLVANNVQINDRLTANEGYISDLQADNVIINNKITAAEADIKKLDTEKLNADAADIKYATIENLNATNAEIYNLKSTYGDFVVVVTDKLDAHDAIINSLESNYANIDFSNIGEAAMENFYAKSGLIENVTIDNATITGKLVGVTISGDLIEGNTIVAEKLVIKGEDGLYYKLNTDGVSIEAEQTEYNSLNGSVIMAKSVTADKISVSDLVAFGATIGGFHISYDSIYSGVKESVGNTTRGIYMDNDGQIAFGDSNDYIKYYKDQNGNYKLDISAESLTFSSSGKNAEEEIDDLKNEITTILQIESSRGIVFKNNSASTVLSVVISHGSKRITDSATMKSVFGDNAYLQWKWQKLDEENYSVISSSDSKISDEGFTFTISPEDVEEKVTFMCELIT